MRYETGTGQSILVHELEDDCLKNYCVIHNPSYHPMRSFPTNWRTGGMFDVKPAHMERVCPHGIGHPDPDGVAFVAKTQGIDLADLLMVHGCDGCCAGSYTRLLALKEA